MIADGEGVEFGYSMSGWELDDQETYDLLDGEKSEKWIIEQVINRRLPLPQSLLTCGFKKLG